MPRGGARTGAGRPRKTLDAQAKEKEARRKTLAFHSIDEVPSGGSETIKESAVFEKSPSKKGAALKKSAAPAFLSGASKEGSDDLPTAAEIYDMLLEYLKSVDCADCVPLNLVEDYSVLRRSFLEAEGMNRRYGRIANGKKSPYVSMSVEYMKSASAVFNQIWLIVSKHADEKTGDVGRNSFLEMLQTRGF
jgi:hypothetical protein